MKEKKTANIFVEGEITPAKVAEMILHHEPKTHIGAHDVFMGQVRADEHHGKKVAGINYTAYHEMANEVYARLKEDIFAKYPIACMHVAHSVGYVPSGKLSLVVFVSSAHRNACMQACGEVVERLKSELPVWGKEVFEDETAQWKENR